jgi:hypothetical protein
MAPWRLHRQVAVSDNGQLLMLVSTERPFSGGVNDIDQALFPEIVESIKVGLKFGITAPMNSNSGRRTGSPLTCTAPRSRGSLAFFVLKKVNL